MNVKELAEKIGLDEDEFLELLELFIETCISDLERLNEALVKNDPKETAEVAHSIKGASGNMGFGKIYELSKHIEMNARNNMLENVRESVELIHSELQKISGMFNREHP